MCVGIISYSHCAWPQVASGKKLEDDIAAALKRTLHCSTVEARVQTPGDGSQKMKSLAIIINNIQLGQFTADRMTLLYENPVIDMSMLKKNKELHFISYSKNKVNILASAESLQKYFGEKAKQYNKKNFKITLKFTPPYVECFYDVPLSEIASESVALLKSFIPGDRIEGYAAFKIEVKDNAMSAYSSKVIVNHFLLPNGILGTFQKRFNPFDQIPVPEPFSYKINSLTVQSKYIYLTN
jgi:hypothetical protein